MNRLDSEKRLTPLRDRKHNTISGNRSSVSNEEHSKLKLENVELNRQLTQSNLEVSRLKDCLKSEKSEVYKWKDLVKELRSLLDGRNEEMERKREEIMTLKESLEGAQGELSVTADKLLRGIDENESLCCKVRQLQRKLNDKSLPTTPTPSQSTSSLRDKSSSRRSLSRIDSLADLTTGLLTQEPNELDKESLVDEYSNLRLRFERAVTEIRALKKELREHQSKQDNLEITNRSLLQQMTAQKEDFCAQFALMTSRVQDLTTKLNVAEKQVRVLKQKASRGESRERRRSQSLKGKESFSLSKDIEAKLAVLEEKVEGLLHEEQASIPELKDPPASRMLKAARRSKSFEDATKSSRLRRKSLEGQTGDEAMKAVLRINELEHKISVLSTEDDKKSSITMGSSSTNSSCSNLTVPSNVAGRGKSPIRNKSPTHAASPLRSPSLTRKSLRSPRGTPEKNLKVSRTDSEKRIIKERVATLEKVITTLHSKLSECLVWANSIEAFCTCNPPTVMSQLKQSLTSASYIANKKSSGKDANTVSRLQPLTSRLYELLRDKISQLMQRRQHLKSNGKWSRDAQLKCFAERLAFETLLLSQIAQTIQAANKPESFEATMRLQDLVEAHRKLSFLEKKLTNPDFDMDPMTPLEFNTSLLAEKLVVQGEIASSMAHRSTTQKPNTSPLNETCKDLEKRLLQRERSLANVVNEYKEEKLHEIALVMARETVTGKVPKHDEIVLLEELKLREAWTMAQEIVNQELVNLEASQSILRLAHLLSGEATSSEATTHLSSMTHEKLHSATEESLRREVEESVFTLSNKYESVLTQYRAGNTAIINSVSANMDAVLGEFASIVAQKAIIDGQMVVATGDDSIASVNSNEPLTIVEDKTDVVNSASDVVASEAHLLMFLGASDSSVESLVQPSITQAEFSYLYNKLGNQLGSEISSVVSAFNQHQQKLQQLSAKSTSSISSDKEGEVDLPSGGSVKIPPSPKARRKSESSYRKTRRASDLTGMIPSLSCRQCEEMRQEVTRLRRTSESKKQKKSDECKNCIQYASNIKTIEEGHRMAMLQLQEQHKAEATRLRDQVKYDPPTRDSDDELTELKRRLLLLEEGYEAQISALKKQYEQSLGQQHQSDGDENVRHKYQIEISHLRDLCEKGLGTMENTHKRMVAELEEKHRRELEALQAEKEQALAEETQATLAALDAMRKAHEAEVQKEIAKFKEEFIRKMQAGQDIGAIHREHEKEMQEIRREILSLSEKYSNKCLECADLEQKAEDMARQVAEQGQQLAQMEKRNKQLSSQLAAHVAQLQSEPDKSPSATLRLQESELTLKDEQIARLNQQLHNKMGCSHIGSHWSQLEAVLADAAGNTAISTSLLGTIWATNNTHKAQEEREFSGGAVEAEYSGRDARLSSMAIKGQIVRSPSCPRLFGSSPLDSPTRDMNGGKGWVAPFSGMVASRKKVFEAALQPFQHKESPILSNG